MHFFSDSIVIHMSSRAHFFGIAPKLHVPKSTSSKTHLLSFTFICANNAKSHGAQSGDIHRIQQTDLISRTNNQRCVTLSSSRHQSHAHGFLPNQRCKTSKQKSSVTVRPNATNSWWVMPLLSKKTMNIV